MNKQRRLERGDSLFNLFLHFHVPSSGGELSRQRVHLFSDSSLTESRIPESVARSTVYPFIRSVSFECFA